MGIDSPETQAYLSELNRMADGDPAAQVSMYDVGEALGLEKDAAGHLAEALFVDGYAELKTLSGGIGITPMGMEALGLSPPGAEAAEDLSLGDGPVLADSGRSNLDRVLSDLKALTASRQADYPVMESVVIDIKTIEVHLLSPQPKTAVIREVLRSLVQALPEKEYQDISGRITAMVDRA